MKNQNWKRTMTVAAVGLMLAAGCAQEQEQPLPIEEPAPATTEPAPAAVPAVETASTDLTGAEGTSYGTVVFTQSGETTTVTASVIGVEPGLHGFHVHATGECTPPDFASAEGHFNPTDTIHGAPTDLEHHAGDLGNIQVAEDGTGTLEVTSDTLTVTAGPNSAVGKAVILHEGEDDFVSQPSGDAGARLACGVVRADGAAMETGGMETTAMETTAMATEEETPTY